MEKRKLVKHPSRKNGTQNRPLSHILCILCAVIFVGCGKNEIQVEKEINQNEYYKTQVYEQQVTKEYSPEMFMMGVDGQKSFFLCAATQEQKNISEDSHEDLKSYFLCAEDLEGGLEKIVDFPSRPYAMNILNEENQTTILTIMRNDGEVELHEYDGCGKEEKTIILQSDIAMSATEVIKTVNESYVLNCGENILVVDEEGKELATIRSENGRIKRIMGQGTEAILAIMENDGELSCAEVSVNEGRLKNTQILTDIKEIYYGTLQEGSLFWNRDGIYIFDSQKKVFEKKVDASEAGIICDRIQSASYQDGEIVLLSWDYNKVGKRVERIRLSGNSVQTVAQSKEAYVTKLKVCVAQIMNESAVALEEYIQEYSLEHPEVEITLEYVPVDKLSMLLLSENSPDLLYFMVDSTVEEFEKNGYLTDLFPLVEDSGLKQKGGLSEGLIEAFGREGALYFLPEQLQIYTLCYIDDDIKEDSLGWTVEEYLTWLETHQGAKNCFFTKEAQIGAVVLGNIDTYVNQESGEVHFDSEEFKDALRRIKEVSLSEEMTFESDVEKQDDYIYAPTLGDMSQLIDLRSFLTTPVRVKGFPNDQGQPVHFLTGSCNYAIPQKAEHKEEAWQFLEYIMLYPEAILDYYETEQCLTEGTVYSVEEFTQRSMELSVGSSSHIRMTQEDLGGVQGEEYIYTATQEDREVFLDIFRNSVREDDMRRQVVDIVIDEAMQYFEGKTDLDNAVRVIQNRVDTYVQEKK